MIIKNAKVYGSDFNFHNQDVYIKDSLIAQKPSTDEKIIDAKGLMCIPSFVDIHLHGANCADFMDGSIESLNKITSYQLLHGVSSICLASMTMPYESLEKAFKCVANFDSAFDKASIEGIYMEGPFISPNKAGAQNKAYLKAPDYEFFKKLNEASGNLIKVLVLACELEGADTLIKKCQDKVQISLGHTNIDYQKANWAFDSGVSQLTHTFNAMPPILHRSPGPIISASEHSKVLAELICDGQHIDKAMIRFAFNLFKDRIVMISDSMMATGLDDGRYSLGGQEVLVKGNKATLKDGTLAGSVTNLYDCFVYAVQEAKIKLEEAIKACTYSPALSIGKHSILGQIKPGFMANLLLVDENLKQRAIIYKGKLFKNDL